MKIDRLVLVHNWCFALRAAVLRSAHCWPVSFNAVDPRMRTMSQAVIPNTNGSQLTELETHPNLRLSAKPLPANWPQGPGFRIE
jgi:hypothetical protein